MPASADLLATARRLVEAAEPTEADLRRAVSTTYYAMFHTLCGTAADTLIGDGAEAQASVAWSAAYRALDHRAARNACRDVVGAAAVPEATRAFARLFVAMQDRRHEADYDPRAAFVAVEVGRDIVEAGRTIADVLALPAPDRRDFAALLLFRRRS